MPIAYYTDETLQEKADLENLLTKAGIENKIAIVMRNEGRDVVEYEPEEFRVEIPGAYPGASARIVNWPKKLKPGEHGMLEFQVTPETGQDEKITAELRWRTTAG